MGAIFMNSENNKASDRDWLLLNLSDKKNLKRGDKYVALSSLSIYYIWRKIKDSYKSNKFKIYVPTWNDKFESPDGSCSVSDTQDYSEYIIKIMKQWPIILQ